MIEGMFVGWQKTILIVFLLIYEINARILAYLEG
jgi:hypothetical protein